MEICDPAVVLYVLNPSGRAVCHKQGGVCILFSFPFLLPLQSFCEKLMFMHSRIVTMGPLCSQLH